MAIKILIVDDDANLRETIKDNLELEGYSTSEAGTGAEAMKAVLSGFYDVILMDFHLPDSTGIEVIRQIKKVNSESQILMLTAHASLDTALKAIQESVYDFLVKPIDFQYLKRTIGKAVDRLRLEQENRRLIEDLKHANEQLLYLSNMKSKFLSMSSHDLSNSLMTLQVAFEMLMPSLQPNEEQKRRIQYISGGIQQLSRLIEDLVDWASIESGKFRLEKGDVSPAKILEEAVPGPQAKASQRGIALSSEAAPGLPMIHADKRRLTQVLGNLLENALRHTPKGGKVSVKAIRADKEVQFAVIDTGEGIKPEELQKIFESFYQPQTQGGQHGRLGLGLSISREIVQSHGGRIWVASEGLGKGATFFFTVPVKA
ncbi:MAG TPA: hybrid sensor histidine kinase/response regulator [Elusimicrobiota bacterium]|jgi:signal transduction histidine kinase|nr:hybrid sensor histidine kinase/response regulator [Elusimicrobiota bacterium]